LIDGVLLFYKNNQQNYNIVGSHFCHHIEVDKYEYGQKLNADCRVAWCYGDLGIGNTFYIVSKFINDVDLKNYAINILLKTAERRGFEKTKVSDDGICHGSSGNGIIFNKLFKETGFLEFSNAVEYYLQMAIGEDEVFNEVKNNKKDKQSLNTASLLTGEAGRGVFLLDYYHNIDMEYIYELLLLM